MPDKFKDRYVKFYASKDHSLTIDVVPGHFATSQSHINYYIDVTRMKVRVKEAENAAKAIRDKLLHRVYGVDTICCFDNTQMLGGMLGQQLAKGGFDISNTHDTIYVVSPEVNSDNQLTFRDNNKLAVEGKKVLILMASLTTGQTLRKSLECVTYYGGEIAGVVSIFSMHESVDGLPVYSLFSASDLPNYEVYSPNVCPMCQKRIPIEALVSGTGYTCL